VCPTGGSKGINLPDTTLGLPALTEDDATNLPAVMELADAVSLVQEEILWLCEAGHVPVVWATQVLDTLARTGRPSRAEVTDAAMSGRAECVMLNKGPFVAEAVAFLDDILTRMGEHQQKKSPLLGQLHAWTEAAPHRGGLTRGR
jgi:pyruvate kinase